MSIAVFSGSFDPVSLGHLDIIKRASKLFDKLYVCVVPNSGKTPMFSSEERVELIRRLVKDVPNIAVETSGGLIARYALDKGASVIIRGLRSASDFDREYQMALVNGKLAPGIETLFLTASEGYAHLSSTVIREMAKYGAPLDEFAPKEIIEDIMSKAMQWR